MNLKNPELFRSWLIRQLEPICKANPEPVSKYVCALLKKEKSDGELKESLISQLDIFLESSTEEFVNFLIDVLENEKYLNDDVEFQPSEPVNLEKDEDVKLDTSIEIELELEDEKKEQRKSPSPIQAPTPSPPRRSQFQKSFSPRQSRRSRFRNERRRVGGRRSRRDSSHSDSPGPERRTTGRRRSASGSSESSTKSPRRSWIASRPSDVKKYKHRNFVARSPPAGQRSRSNSPKLRKRKPTNGNFRKRPRPASRSNSDEERSSYNVSQPKRVANYQNEINRDMHVAEIPASEPTFNQKQRCIDFESKGYCARGDMCPFDHGPAPIVLDNSLLNGIVPLPPPVHNNAFQDLYQPQYVNTSFPPKPFRTENAPQVTNRELISVPTTPLPQKFDNKQKNLHAGKPSYGHIFSSLPPGVSQTTIELSNVPAELNNIPSLYENFSSFGNITLIQAKRNGDANTALLTYTNATEAALAFINVDSTIPKAKVAWYADKCILKPFPRKSIPASGQTNAKSYVLKRNPAAPSAANPTANDKTSPIKPTTPVKPTPPKSPVGEPNKVPEVRKQDPGRLLSDLIKKKKELLEKQLSSRKEIEDKMKSLEKTSKDYKTWSEVLKKLNDVIAEGQKSLQSSLIQRKEYLQKMNIVPMDSATINSMKEQQNKPPKPTTPVPNHAPPKPENDSDNVLNSSNESDQVEEPVFEIDVDSSILGQELENDEEPVKPSQGDAKSDKETESKTPPANIDYTRVVITGFENGDEEDLIKHFAQFGTILDKEIDKTIPQTTIIYDNRKSAEEAKKEGRNFQDRLLSVTVYGGKKYQPLVRRVATFKPQYEKEFPSYAPYGGGGAASAPSGNPYKYTKNQQPHAPVSTPAPRPASRSVYSYRADQKSRGGANQVSKSAENTVMKLTEEEDLVTFLQKGGIDAKEVEKYMD
ncbi:zinc finger protein swm-like [Planococcus citri]|uniref:zinc finger protein swm-like n=1 Tax=Planococcus citri TaxID=170843 RepID=UPI0031F89606